ncbi:hypothetical protein LT23_05148 [Klebsiella pneumoniae]|nr:hypothetical protein LT23_05148 [Klebsiella pneumoniae]
MVLSNILEKITIPVHKAFTNFFWRNTMFFLNFFQDIFCYVHNCGQSPNATNITTIVYTKKINVKNKINT